MKLLSNKTPRWYQDEGSDTIIKVIKDKNKHPICAIPTGAGKTLIICLIILKWLKDNPNKNVLVLSHVKEILEQNYKSLKENLDEEIGLYSAGFNSKEIKRVTVAGIQSARNNKDSFKNFGIIIIDECHLVSEYDEGTYRAFLSSFSNVNYVGLTATPFRARGYIHLSEEKLFTEIAYDLTTYKMYNRLVKEGYLAKLYSKPTNIKLTVPKGVRSQSGDWVNNDLDILFNNDRVTDAALVEVDNILKSGFYKKVLVFCINIKHAESVSNKFNVLGYKSNFVHSKMEQDRDEVFKSFRNGDLDILTNVEVATIGLDVPDIDMIVLLRPTQSLALYSQMVGRGSRPFPDKEHCLILDFAENVSRLGPVNDLKIDQKGKPIKGGDAPTKECPNCGILNHPIAKHCIACGHEFLFKVKLTQESSELSVVKKIEPQELTVASVSYNRHKKKGRPDSLRIDYRVGLRKYSKWLSVESNSLNAAESAFRFVQNTLKDGEEINQEYTVENLLKNSNKFKKPIKIIVDVNEKYPEIQKVIYED